MFSLANMKKLHENASTGEIELYIDTLDDLYELNQIIEEGDYVSAKTERKITFGTDRTKQVRKTFFLTGKVLHTELETEVLRIQTVLEETPDDMISKGDHHGFSVQKGTKIRIKKDWDAYTQDRLRRAIQEKTAETLIVTFDREEGHIAELTKRGVQEIAYLKGDVSKKTYEGGKENFFSTLAKHITEIDTRKTYPQIILASPAFWTEYVYALLPEEKQKKVTLATCNAVGKQAIQEVLKRPELKQSLEKQKQAQEEQTLERILKAIHQDNACYGRNDCMQASNEGRIKELIVSHTLIQKAKEEGWYEELHALIEQTKNTQATVHFFEQQTQQLNALGGVAGILRW